MASFFSDKLASPRGASCPLFSPGSPFFRSAACFVLPLAALAGSAGLPVRFGMTFASPSTISSSTSSLRIAWAIRAHQLESVEEQRQDEVIHGRSTCASRADREKTASVYIPVRSAKADLHQAGGDLATTSLPRRTLDQVSNKQNISYPFSLQKLSYQSDIVTNILLDR
jgi:hypothetical protein